MKSGGLITGGNRGLGLECCRQLAEKQNQVILTFRNDKKGAEAAESLRKSGASIISHALDVTMPESVDQLYRYVKSEFGRLDILINNAGIFPEKGDGWDSGATSAFKTDLSLIKQCLETN